jgi:hypothetical protein
MVSVRRRFIFWLALPAFAMLAGAPASAGASGAAAPISERTALDRQTGLAIYGYDPVAYFTEAEARRGRLDYEHFTEGATWRFRNAGNRAAFMDRPDVYLPRFGGHDPSSIARGVAVPGHPELWLIHSGRLYLFANAAGRVAFKANPDQMSAAAESEWPEVRERLTP